MLFLLALLASFAVVDAAWSRRADLSRRGLVTLAGLAAALLAVAILALPRGFVLGKVLGQLVMPVGLLWLVLLALAAGAYHRRRHRQTAAFGALFVAFTLAGSSYVGDFLLARLERPFEAIDPLTQAPFDAVFVLGGGTVSDRRGRPYLASSGDRVALGARLYHAGLTPLLVTSGSTPPGVVAAHDGAEATTALWTGLGVPSAAILRVDGAHNTRDEAVAYARLARRRGLRRIGLVTSAWHLRRAMRLFEAQQLSVVPLGADRRGMPHWDGLWSLVPRGSGFDDVQTATWELVGAAVGR